MENRTEKPAAARTLEMSLGAARPSKTAREPGMCTHSPHMRRVRLVRSASFVTSDFVRLLPKAIVVGK